LGLRSQKKADRSEGRLKEAAAVGGVVMAVPRNDKHKDYVRYAEHCLKMVPAAADQEYQAVQREMAVAWLKLADAALHPSKRMD
jgi:hypothetical protein